MSHIEKFIADFERGCREAGHYWADDPRAPNGQYCQGCGAIRTKPEDVG